MIFVLSFVSMIVLCMGGREAWKTRKHAWKRGHAWKAIDRCRDYWKDGRRSLEGSVLVLYILLSLPSVREIVGTQIERMVSN